MWPVPGEVLWMQLSQRSPSWSHWADKLRKGDHFRLWMEKDVSEAERPSQGSPQIRKNPQGRLWLIPSQEKSNLQHPQGSLTLSWSPFLFCVLHIQSFPTRNYFGILQLAERHSNTEVRNTDSQPDIWHNTHSGVSCLSLPHFPLLENGDNNNI